MRGHATIPTKLAKDRMRIPQGSAKRNYSFPTGSCHSEIGNYMRLGITIFPGHWQEETQKAEHTPGNSIKEAVIRSMPGKYAGKNQAGKRFGVS